MLYVLVSIHAFRGEGDSALLGDAIHAHLVSIHAFRGEGDLKRQSVWLFGVRFNPRLPGGRRLGVDEHIAVRREFQSTPSGGKATERLRFLDLDAEVSIHAFRGEGDGASGRRGASPTPVSIHAFRGEGDVKSSGSTPRYSAFQSTPSGGKATAGGSGGAGGVSLVSIHAFRGEGDRTQALHIRAAIVSIHAFRGEGDRRVSPVATHFRVSIHAFRGEGDGAGVTTRYRNKSFNPRLPGGRRLQFAASLVVQIWFQSTPSGGKATQLRVPQHQFASVSIHAFRGEGDAASIPINSPFASFQSTPSGGKATLRDAAVTLLSVVSIHAFRGEGDRIHNSYNAQPPVSIHAFRGEGDYRSPKAFCAG